MVPKLLAWTAFALAALFAVLAFVVMFARESVGASALPILLYAGLPILGLAILLAISLLVISAFRS